LTIAKPFNKDNIYAISEIYRTNSEDSATYAKQRQTYLLRDKFNLFVFYFPILAKTIDNTLMVRSPTHIRSGGCPFFSVETRVERLYQIPAQFVLYKKDVDHIEQK
jgi:hypothetical protein